MSVALMTQTPDKRLVVSTEAKNFPRIVEELKKMGVTVHATSAFRSVASVSQLSRHQLAALSTAGAVVFHEPYKTPLWTAPIVHPSLEIL